MMICTDENMVGLDVSSLIPVEMGGTLVTRHRTQSSMVGDLGKKLLQSSREGDMEAVQDLLSKGAPFNSDWLGTSALHLAVMNNHFETCEALLRAGIGKDSRTKVDRTPLHFAAYEGHAAIAKLLLENGVEVDCRDMLRMTPLHWAVERGHGECAHILLNYGADCKAESKFKKTPLSIAAAMGWTEMSNTLRMTSTLEATQSIEITQENMEEEPEPEFELREEEDLLNISLKEGESDVNEVDNELLDSEKDAQNALAALLPQVEESTNEATMQLLKEHGITMLPTDDSNMVTSAMQSGRKIVLSDAGKLVLKDCKFQKEPPKPVDIKNKPTILPTGKLKNTKIYTMSSSQFLAFTGQSKPNILQKVPLDTIKKAVSNAGLNFVQIPKTSQVINMSTGKAAPLTKNTNIVNTGPLKSSPSTITVVKKAKGDVLTVPHSAIKGEIINLNQLTGQGKKPKVIQLKSGSGLGNAVKIVMNKNSLGKFMSQMPLNSQISNGNIIQKDISNPQKTTIALDKKSDMFMKNFIDNTSQVERLKSELALAKLEIEQYKKKVHSMQNEILVYKNKLKCSALMDIEAGSIV